MEEKTTPRAEDFEATLSDLFAEFEDSVGDDGDTSAEAPEEKTSDSDDTAADEETPSDSDEPPSEEEEKPKDTEESPAASEESAEEAPAASEEPKEGEEPSAENPTEESAYERQEREDLAAVVAAHPEVKLTSLRDLGRMQYAKYIGMRLAGYTALEAYDEICPAKSPETPITAEEPPAPEKPANKPASKGHLNSVAPKSHGAPEGMTREELSAARDLFPSLSEKEIHSLYRRTKKN